MNFNKLAKSDKFEYMMLSRLIQDAKYFIDYPDLKHLWTKTLDKHIKQMKEQYAKLDPKPEWISEEEINNLAKQMKESYTNHWNEVHPDNKIEASDSFKVSDKVFFDTLYEFQEDDLGFNYNRGILKEIKHWPYNNREYYIVQTDDGKLLEVGHVFHTEEEVDAFRNNWMNPKFEKESTITQPTSPKPTAQLPQNMEYAWDPKANTWIAVMKDNPVVTPPTYNPNNIQNQNTTNYMSTVKSASCLEKFLYNPQYSKEIKIEAGLIKEGLVKYAGFDFNRGTKYVITDKGLKFLKAYKEQELNEAQNEREKLAYLFGFNTDEVSTLDTTGKVIKNSKKWTICEVDGTELGEVEADSELDAKVKFGIEHPEYADSLSICAKEIDAKYEETTNTKEPYPNPSETPHDDVILENHTGWVNTANLKDKSVYRKLFILAKMLEDYRKKELIWSAESEDDNIEIITGDAKVINELEHKIKDLGFYCESILQSELPETGLIYSLKIFLDEE